MYDYDEDEEDFDFQELEETSMAIKASLLCEMDALEFTRWIGNIESGTTTTPSQQNLLACLPWCNEWQEAIVLRLLAELYQKED